MSEPSRSGGCLGFVFTMLAVIFGAFMTAYNQSSLISIPLPPTAIVTHISLAPIGAFTTDELQQASTVIKKRLNKLLISGSTIKVDANDGSIQVNLPQVDNLDDVLRAITARGLLEFVDFSDVPDFGGWIGRAILTTGQGDHRISSNSEKNPVTNHPFETVLTGDDVKSAAATLSKQPGNDWQVTIEFNDPAAKVLSDYTRTHIGKPLAIVVDGNVLRVPVIQAEVSNFVTIQGNFTEQEAVQLTVQISGGALPFQMAVRHMQSDTGTTSP